MHDLIYESSRWIDRDCTPDAKMIIRDYGRNDGMISDQPAMHFCRRPLADQPVRFRKTRGLGRWQMVVLVKGSEQRLTRQRA